MNTSKQVNVMIGLLFLSFVVFGGYIVNENSRQDEAREEVTERVAERGARLFVNNCRSCHGMDGLGGEEGAVAPALNSPAYLILGEHNEFDLDATPEGVGAGIRDFLFDTIACGRTGTFMPTWAETFGGPLSDTQVNQLVTLIVESRWDLVEEIGAEHDAEPAVTAEDIIIPTSEIAGLAITENNCGQYGGAAAREFRARDPFAPPGASPEPTAEATATAAPSGGGDGPTVAVSLGEWFIEADPDEIEAGDLNFDVSNDGNAGHELVVVRTDLAADALPVEAGLVDMAAVEEVARVEQFPGGQTRQQAVTLTAGNYALICNIPGHYDLGMTTGFTVN